MGYQQNNVPDKEMDLALIPNLKKDGYPGKVALTATNNQEAAAFEKAGANWVFRPIGDATEQVDALAYTIDFLSESVCWPVSILELRIRSDASTVGQTLQVLPLSASGISVLAVSRGGASFTSRSRTSGFFQQIVCFSWGIRMV